MMLLAPKPSTSTAPSSKAGPPHLQKETAMGSKVKSEKLNRKTANAEILCNPWPKEAEQGRLRRLGLQYSVDGLLMPTVK